MGDTYETMSVPAVPVENVRGISVAGPPAEVPEPEENEETGDVNQAGGADAVQRETTQYAEGVGENVDVEA